MSFSDLVKANYKPKEKEVKIALGDKELVFKAVEISASLRISIGGTRAIGEDWASELIVACILDPDGKRMTLEQAKALEQEHAMKFYIAACEVNFPGEEIKN